MEHFDKCPDGYIPLVQYCRKNGVTQETASKWIKQGKLQALCIGRHYYVPEDAISARKKDMPKCNRGDCRFCFSGRCQILTENLNKPARPCVFFKVAKK